jgi:hypothetical protein
MSKHVVFLMTIAITCVAAAQTADPRLTAKERQEATRSTTSAAANSTTGATTAKQQEANVKASKGTAKMTTAEKNQAIRDSNKQMVNPDNSSGVGANANMQKQTTAESKGQPRQKVNINTPEAQKALQKAATP